LFQHYTDSKSGVQLFFIAHVDTVGMQKLSRFTGLMKKPLSTLAKCTGGIFLLSLIIVFYPAISHGSQFISKKTVTISKMDQIDDDVYIFANYGKVNGMVNGDLTAFCYDINSVGEITGNANLFGYRVDLHGQVERSARLFGNIINCSGDIAGNMLVCGNEISLGEKGIIGRDMNCYGAKITIDGTVKGNLKVAGDRIVISGTVEGDADIKGESILIVPPANIKGTLTYTSKKEAVIEEGAVIQGEKTWKRPMAEKDGEEEKGGISIFSIIVRIILFFMALVAGLVILFLFKEHTRESARQIIENFWVTLARGCLAFIIFTAGVMVLFVLILGIPLGILLISLGMILFYLGKIYVSISLGRIIFGIFDRQQSYSIGWELLLGLIILTIFFQIPYLGWIIYIGAFILGSGAAVNGYIALYRRRQTATSGAP